MSREHTPTHKLETHARMPIAHHQSVCASRRHVPLPHADCCASRVRSASRCCAASLAGSRSGTSLALVFPSTQYGTNIRDSEEGPEAEARIAVLPEKKPSPSLFQSSEYRYIFRPFQVRPIRSLSPETEIDAVRNEPGATAGACHSVDEVCQWARIVRS